MTKKVRCECGKTLFHVHDNALEIKCPRSGHVTKIELSPSFSPPSERRPRRAAGTGVGNNDESREPHEGQEDQQQETETPSGLPDGR